MFSRGEPRGEGGRRDVGRAAALHRRDTVRPARLSHWRHREQVERVALREGDGEEGATPRVHSAERLARALAARTRRGHGLANVNGVCETGRSSARR